VLGDRGESCAICGNGNAKGHMTKRKDRSESQHNLCLFHKCALGLCYGNTIQ
jgi:hypothetical protein